MAFARLAFFWAGLAMLAASCWAFLVGLIGWGGGLAVGGVLLLFLRHRMGRTRVT